MRKALTALGLAFGLAAMATGAAAQDRQQQRNMRNSYANPSAVIAAEIAFAQLAQEKGQWTAFAQTATVDAVMFVPQMVWAQEWLKGRANPAQAVKWQPHIVWSSCDGSLMVSHGAWQGAAGKTGYFTTIWQRQKDGKFKWVLDHGDELKEPLLAPDMLSGQIADCPDKAGRSAGPVPRVKDVKKRDLPLLDPARRAGKSLDGTLWWEVTVEPDGARNLSVSWKKDGAESPVVIEQVDAPPKG
ncbi:MAG: hypothetical protein ACKOPO_14930 [Novosphingobium sp.]